MATTQQSIFASYDKDPKFYDEIFDEKGNVKKVYQTLFDLYSGHSSQDFAKLNDKAKASFFNQGITFQVYTDQEAKEKIFPFDLFPRIIDQKEWDTIERGVLQRSKALNHFIWDIYHDKKIIKQGIVPLDLITSSANYLHQMIGVDPPGGIYNHISGTDLIKHSDGKYYVLEDNIRCPSGVSYVICNRTALKRALFGVFNHYNAHTVTDYAQNLLEIMESVKPRGVDEPNCVVITPGVYNSAYYEHSYLAKSMGVELVEGRDLFVENDFVYMQTIKGPERVDVIYRRIDDAFLDPLEFRPDSALGVPGLFSAYKKGNVCLVNAPGTGFADDKAVYTYMPEIIKYYLGEEPILNNVHTYHCSRPDELKYVLENVDKLVIKPVDEAGGYGISIGNRLTQEEIEKVKKTIQASPRKYIAQPIMSLSVHATYIEESESFESRHVDLRTFCLQGADKDFVLKGGLTRVALKKGNLIVNSSQGGGSKDTWVLKK
ncbi:putative circularly permuted ATP-grasp superfamily protein [Leeuwenhoekiella aestuarii]|uniref:Putative circularly permuted ATP-grasp superfamily protein n=1 Tax=Leeuwenhoekiella aestuarii TaxID=2249426 RepID=A0A4Q0NV40_9FLAO|nr:circularly permuted type 2 ATP-grasp protein [Leeuwenhoekiella aestuarii]RXG15262.1 putative circularly permuted ATP-grasp superfamily protein [Leeuwenhoekiella aestuarii]RXG17630.1 putative circularly permuted ATP-grasp superfamily protein [Leeuwenhoekiella aestuarii]